MVHNILKNTIDLILPQFSTRQTQGIIASLVSGFIGLAYEGISSFLHNKRHKALQKAVNALDIQSITQCNKLMHLENSMVMYGIYNAETLEKLKNTVHHSHNITTPYENYSQESKIQDFFILYTLTLSMPHTTIVTLSCLVKKVPLQELFIAQSLASVWYDRFSR